MCGAASGPVLDLKKFFDLPERGLTDLHRIILVGDHSLELGVLADTILGVRSLAATDLLFSLPTLTCVRSDYLKGVTAERLVVLDLARILADPRILGYMRKSKLKQKALTKVAIMRWTVGTKIGTGFGSSGRRWRGPGPLSVYVAHQSTSPSSPIPPTGWISHPPSPGNPGKRAFDDEGRRNRASVDTF